jgi:hypothetical protein
MKAAERAAAAKRVAAANSAANAGGPPDVPPAAPPVVPAAALPPDAQVVIGADALAQILAACQPQPKFAGAILPERAGSTRLKAFSSDHFLQTCTVTSSLGESNASIRPGKGCLQGGVLSAIISWNIVFDDFLKLYDNSEITSICFADDGTLLITGICIHTMYSRM